MRRRLLTFALLGLFLFSSTATIVINPRKAAALSGGDFNNSNIIDDAVFFDGQAMTPTQIQQFLNAKVPVCDTNHAGSGSNQPPFTCLKDFRQDTPARAAEAGLCGAYGGGNKSAAEIIYLVGALCGVSQKTILVTLQKEQALVTDTWPWNIQYQAAMGYGCPDTAACDSTYYGFFNQVYAAARQFKYYVKNAGSFNYRAGATGFVQYNPNGACGGTNITMHNSATADLYNYTPYQPNAAALANLYGTGDSCSAYGNRNFWRLFNDWFGTTKPASKWLRRDSSGQVWLVVEGTLQDGSYARKRWRLNNWDIYLAYFLQYEPVITVSDDYLSQYTDDGALGTRTIGTEYGQMQFANNGYRYYIPGAQTCTDWGFDCFNTNLTKTIPGTEFLERLTGTAQAVPPALAQGNVVYKLQNGQKLAIADAQTMVDLGLSWGNTLANVQAINAQQPLGPIQISHQVVIQFPNAPVEVYDPGAQQFHRVAAYDDYVAWGMQNYAIVPAPDSAQSTTPPSITAPDLSIWAQDGGGHKYIVDQGRKIDVTSVTSSLPSQTWQTYTNELLGRLPTAAFGQFAIDKQTGGVYSLENGQKRLVPSWNDFVNLGLTIPGLLPLSDHTLTQIPDGPYKLGDSSLVDLSSGIWMINGNSKLHVPTFEYFSYFNTNPAARITNQSNLDGAYSSAGELSVLVKNGVGSTYVMQNGTKLNIDPATQAQWGLTLANFEALSDRNMSRLPTVGNLGRFVFVNGQGLWYAANGQKHHIDSYNSYLGLGGNPGNTFVVAPEFTAAVPTGVSVP